MEPFTLFCKKTFPMACALYIAKWKNFQGFKQEAWQIHGRDALLLALPTTGQRLRLLKFTWKEPSKGENEKSNTVAVVTEAFHPALPAQVADFAAKQLIDIFLLECLIGKMSLQSLSFFEKEHSGMVLDSLMLDILLQQFFSIRQWQQTTFENVPLRDFHRKAFTEVALDVILTELNKLAVEDMEDLLEYERGIQEYEQKRYQKHQEAE